MNECGKCSTENCKNERLRQKDLCKQCTEIKALRYEIRELHDKIYDLEEHVINMETDQGNVMKKRRVHTAMEEIDKRQMHNLTKNIEAKLSEITKNFEAMDRKIDEALQKRIETKTPTYASALGPKKDYSMKTVDIVHTMVAKIPFSEKIMDEELLRRNKNAIVYGFYECHDIDKDQEKMRNFLQEIDVSYSPIKAYRLGRNSVDTRKPRPFKLIFRSVEEKDDLLHRFRMKMKSIGYEQVYIRNDYSSEESRKIRDMVEEAKVKNSKSQDVVWKVRGCPRTDLRLEPVNVQIAKGSE